MKNKKISVITSGDFPYGGAAENFVRLMAIGMHKAGNTPEVIRYRGSRYDNKTHDVVPSSNFLFSKPRNGNFWNILEQIIIRMYIPFFIRKRKLKHLDDVFILYGLDFSPLTRPFLFWCKKYNIECYRIITDYYDDKVVASAWWKNIKHTFYRKQFKDIDKKLTGIIVVSKYLYDYSIRCGVDENRLIIIPHFIETHKEKLSLDNSDKKFTVCYAGTLNKENGVYDLIKAFKIINSNYTNSRLILLGTALQELKEYLMKDELKDLDIDLKGFLSKEKVREFCALSSVLVNPRISGRRANAGFPTKLGEYLTFDTPVVSTKVGDIPNYFTNGKELLLAEADDPVSLAETIMKLYNAPELKAELVHNAKKWVEENLDYVKNAQKLLNFIR